ncbi:hypothetical protein BPT24_276 [Tenacibaculum phage pT24]|uniref:Uncharacterized protein n=1 Tax=Tenacibaculum phage pT24 TaxID=1880590 RepID=A0A1B4XX63_9CAUD|nr:hypothetical protein HYP10_gp252 [Tenacibaculum phage pT24]BAV39393.1 hypothetical protein BPT24_276 [Tenacibaculum phage pT24]
MYKLTETLKEQCEIVVKYGTKKLETGFKGKSVKSDDFLSNIFMELESLNVNRTNNKIANYIKWFIKYDGSWDCVKEYLQSEKERMNKDKFTRFEHYYSEDLFLVMDVFKKMEVDLYDFHTYLENMSILNDLSPENLKYCIDNEFLDIWNIFDTNFRGTILTHYTGESDEQLIFKTSKKDCEEFSYYVPRVRKIDHYCFDSFESAMTSAIFGGRFEDTLGVLLNQVKNENQ